MEPNVFDKVHDVDLRGAEFHSYGHWPRQQQ